MLFDVAAGKVLEHSPISIRKSGNAVHYVSGERFLIWNSTGIQVCDIELQCGIPVGTSRPLSVSPGGTTAVFLAGNGQLTVIDLLSRKKLWRSIANRKGRSFPEIGRFRSTIFRERQPGKLDAVVPHYGYQTSFLNATTFAHWGAAQAVVRQLDGKERYRIPVPETWKSAFVTTSQGVRFGIYEYGYTRSNSVLNFWDIDNARPPDFQRIRILDTANGAKVAEFEWDPRPYLVKPALSPSGHRLARIRSQFVEVLPIP